MDDILIILTIVVSIVLWWIIFYGFKQYKTKFIHTTSNNNNNKSCEQIETKIWIDQQKLIYYIDGSYSHRMQIGHSGFRTSNGSSLVHYYSPQCPKRGSTESEVFAAYLAIQHAMNNCHNLLIICTDNSKVKQLLSRPKIKDTYEYPSFCHMLNTYREENKQNIIQVEYVRGHPTRSEQNQCELKHEFARIDRLVRNKNRRYIRQQRIKSERYYLYWYS